MEFKDKYISRTEKQDNPTSKKFVIDDNYYAIGDIISDLIKQLEKNRVSLK